MKFQLAFLAQMFGGKSIILFCCNGPVVSTCEVQRFCTSSPNLAILMYAGRGKIMRAFFRTHRCFLLFFLDYGIRSDLQSGSFFDFFVDDFFQTLFGVELCINESWNSGCVVRANWNACSSVDDSIR